MTEEEQKKTFGKNLSYYVAQSGKEQKQIAKELGYEVTTFNTWCKGKIIPRAGKIQHIADYFHIGKSFLLDDREQLLKDAYIKNSNHDRLINLYDSLNESGQEHVDSYISYVASDRKYQKNPLPILMAAHDDVVSEDETAKLKDDLDNL